jgi:hypothetical protein
MGKRATAVLIFALACWGGSLAGCSQPLFQEGQQWNVRVAEEENVMQVTIRQARPDGWVRVERIGQPTPGRQSLPESAWLNSRQVIWATRLSGPAAR